MSVPLQTCSSFGPYLGSEHKHEEHCSIQDKKPPKAVGTISPEWTARKSSRNKKELKLKIYLAESNTDSRSEILRRLERSSAIWTPRYPGVSPS